MCIEVTLVVLLWYLTIFQWLFHVQAHESRIQIFLNKVPIKKIIHGKLVKKIFSLKKWGSKPHILHHTYKIPMYCIEWGTFVPHLLLCIRSWSTLTSLFLCRKLEGERAFKFHLFKDICQTFTGKSVRFALLHVYDGTCWKVLSLLHLGDTVYLLPEIQQSCCACP